MAKKVQSELEQRVQKRVLKQISRTYPNGAISWDEPHAALILREEGKPVRYLKRTGTRLTQSAYDRRVGNKMLQTITHPAYIEKRRKEAQKNLLVGAGMAASPFAAMYANNIIEDERLRYQLTRPIISLLERSKVRTKPDIPEWVPKSWEASKHDLNRNLYRTMRGVNNGLDTSIGETPQWGGARSEIPLYHGGKNKYRTISQPPFHRNTGIPYTDTIWASRDPEVAERFAMGNLYRKRGYVHIVDPKGFGYDERAIGNGWAWEWGYKKRGDTKPIGGYWVHKNKDGKIIHTTTKPYTLNEKLFIGGAAAAGLSYVGYKTYQHRDDIKEKAHEVGNNVHNTFHSTHEFLNAKF